MKTEVRNVIYGENSMSYSTRDGRREIFWANHKDKASMHDHNAKVIKITVKVK